MMVSMTLNSNVRNSGEGADPIDKLAIWYLEEVSQCLTSSHELTELCQEDSPQLHRSTPIETATEFGAGPDPIKTATDWHMSTAYEQKTTRRAYRQEDLDLLRTQVEAPHAILPNLPGRPLPSLCNLGFAALLWLQPRTSQHSSRN